MSQNMEHDKWSDKAFVNQQHNVQGAMSDEREQFCTCSCHSEEFMCEQCCDGAYKQGFEAGRLSGMEQAAQSHFEFNAEFRNANKAWLLIFKDGEDKSVHITYEQAKALQSSLNWLVEKFEAAQEKPTS